MNADPQEVVEVAEAAISEPRQGSPLTEQSFALFLFFFAAIYCWTSLGLSFGSLDAPKAGFLPRIAGTLGLVLTAINALLVFARRGVAEGGRTNPLRAAVFTAGLAAFVALLEPIGFGPATLVVTLFLLKVAGVPGWKMPVAVAAGLAGGLYLLFAVLLKLSLP